MTKPTEVEERQPEGLIETLRKAAYEEHGKHGTFYTRCFCICGQTQGGPANTKLCKALAKVLEAQNREKASAKTTS